MSAPLISDALPELAQELETLLVKEGEPELAAQIRQLHIVDRCRCGEDSCGQFYTVPRPKGSWGTAHRNVSLDGERGMLILDVVGDKVTSVEVLDRADIREKLDEILPLSVA
jgi:hypothetical protein